MKYFSDLHTHTIVSGHAYTTLLENITHCSKNGIKILGTSDHAPKMPGAPHKWYFGNLKVLPRIIDNVILLKGCETNILNINGDIDLDESELYSLDYTIASFHEPVFTPLSLEENTKAMLNTMDNNDKLEILGHLGNPNYKLDYEAVVRKAKEKDLMIEINNSSLLGSSRKGSNENCKKIALLCKEIGTKVILTSDSHYKDSICVFNKALELLDEINMPEELIMNDPEKLINHFKSKGKLQDLV